MRLLGTLLVVVAIMAGAGLGWAAREWRGIAPARARVAAMDWMRDVMGYQAPEVMAVERFDQMADEVGPVYGVSSRVRLLGEDGRPLSLCWGVIVDADSGQVRGAVGGNIEWLVCN